MKAVKPNLPDACKTAYELVRSHPASTAGELEALAKDENLHKRLIDLYRLGLVDRGAKRHCKISKRKADTWVAYILKGVTESG